MKQTLIALAALAAGSALAAQSRSNVDSFKFFDLNSAGPSAPTIGNDTIEHGGGSGGITTTGDVNHIALAGNIAMGGQALGKKSRGFAAMDPERRREIASQGGRTAHQKGVAYEFTSETARAAAMKPRKLGLRAS